MEKDPYLNMARLYDRIYHWKDYLGESERLASLLEEEGIGEGSHILEAGCGTGTYLAHLTRRFRMSGFDISDAMLEVAKSKLPGIELFQADMADVEVLTPYDAVLCLFSSIGYVYPQANLERTARSFARAVRAGGVVIIEPWLTAAAYDEGRPSVQTYNGEELAISRMCVAKAEGEFSVLKFEYCVAFRDHEVERFSEEHRMWMTPHDLLLSAFEKAGFSMRFEPDGLMKNRGLFVGRRIED